MKVNESECEASNLEHTVVSIQIIMQDRYTS